MVVRSGNHTGVKGWSPVGLSSVDQRKLPKDPASDTNGYVRLNTGAPSVAELYKSYITSQTRCVSRRIISIKLSITFCTNIMSNSEDRKPVADQAEDDAWFPSPFSLTQYVGPKTDFDGADYPNAQKKGGKWKILVIGTQERYLKMADGKFFSTGNHPVEMLLPMLHLHEAGFELDIATLTGEPVKLEMWAFPKEDEAVKGIYETYKQKMRNPLALSDVWGNGFTKDTPYIGVFVPGGHGALNGIPQSPVVGNILRWADANKRYLITLCHGPACMLAADLAKPAGEKFIYDGYKIDVFPDSLDNGANIDIGYIPGKMSWLVGAELNKLGVTPINEKITGETHQDRYVLTGDSPLASNNLGKLAANTLLKEIENMS